MWGFRERSGWFLTQFSKGEGCPMAQEAVRRHRTSCSADVVSRGHLPKAQQLMGNSELSLVTQQENQTWLREGSGSSLLCFLHSGGGGDGCVMSSAVTNLPLSVPSARYPPGMVSVAPGGIPAAMEGIIPGGIPVTHSLPTVAHPSQAPSPNQPTKHGDNREHPNEQ